MPTDISAGLVEVLVGRVDRTLPIDPIASALDAIATYFEGVPGIAAALRGWPEHPESLDLTQGPVVSVVYAGEVRTAVPPAPLAGSSPTQWRVGELRIDAQLDLWTAYRAQRDDAARAVEDAFHNSLPARSGLRLMSTGYYSRPLVVEASGGRNADNESASATEGEWRRTWLLSISTDLVATLPGGRTMPVLQTLTLRPTVNDVLEPDTDIT